MNFFTLFIELWLSSQLHLMVVIPIKKGKKRSSNKNYLWKPSERMSGILECRPTRDRKYRSFRAKINVGSDGVKIYKRSKPDGLINSLGYLKWGLNQIGKKVPNWLNKDTIDPIECTEWYFHFFSFSNFHFQLIQTLL